MNIGCITTFLKYSAVAAAAISAARVECNRWVMTNTANTATVASTDCDEAAHHWAWPSGRKVNIAKKTG